MNGGVSQVDSFDPKPMLDKYHGQPLPGGEVATERKTGTLLRSPFTFKKYGQSGIEVSEILPHVGECADDICFVRSVHTDIPNHEPSMLMMNTGHTQAGRPSMGAWMTYGLGIRQQESARLRRALSRRADDRGSAAVEQRVSAGGASGHVHLRQGRAPRSDDRQGLRSEEARVSSSTTRTSRCRNSGARWTCSKSSTRCARPAKARDPQLEAAINSMEVAYRMQTEAPDVFDIRKESEATLKLYGTGSTARGCLMAVRLAETRRADGAGLLRQGRSLGSPQRHPAAPQEREGLRSAVCRGDQGPQVARAASRTRSWCAAQNSAARRSWKWAAGAGPTQNGRDHNPFGFTMWLAGGGIKGGMTYGATDDFGFKAVENPVHVHDLHATILHLHGDRSHQADVPLQRTRLQTDGRLGTRDSRNHRVIRRTEAPLDMSEAWVQTTSAPSCVRHFAIRPLARGVAGRVRRADAIGRRQP